MCGGGGACTRGLHGAVHSVVSMAQWVPEDVSLGSIAVVELLAWARGLNLVVPDLPALTMKVASRIFKRCGRVMVMVLQHGQHVVAQYG